MKEPVITHLSIPDKIKLENQYEFLGNTTLGLAEGGDFYLKVDFLELTFDNLQILAELSKLPRSLKISSDLISKEGYKITEIVVTRFTSSSNLTMTWECLSDEPSIYEGFDLK